MKLLSPGTLPARIHPERAQRNSSRPGRSPKRRGLTLYEVMLSLAILMPALLVLSQGISNGSRASRQARLQTEAILRCDSLVAEVIAGVRPLTPSDHQPFEDGSSGWYWSLQIGGSAMHPDLLVVEATVTHEDAAGVANASYTLTREVRDPALFEAAATVDPTLTGVTP